MKYFDPKNVKSPKDTIKEVKVIYDGGVKNPFFSMAKIKWKGKWEVGIRWNVGMREWNNSEKERGVKRCVGVPSSRGYPTWFILPKELLNKNSEMWKRLDEFIQSEENQ